MNEYVSGITVSVLVLVVLFYSCSS